MRRFDPDPRLHFYLIENKEILRFSYDFALNLCYASPDLAQPGGYVRLTEKRRLPADTKGGRVLTPYGEIHVQARTLVLIQDWSRREYSGDEVCEIASALMFDFAAGFISRGLAEEINRRVGRVLRGKPARLAPKVQA
jgi:hypothetical protein